MDRYNKDTRLSTPPHLLPRKYSMSATQLKQLEEDQEAIRKRVLSSWNELSEDDPKGSVRHNDLQIKQQQQEEDQRIIDAYAPKQAERAAQMAAQRGADLEIARKLLNVTGQDPSHDETRDQISEWGRQKGEMMGSESNPPTTTHSRPTTSHSRPTNPSIVTRCPICNLPMPCGADHSATTGRKPDHSATTGRKPLYQTAHGYRKSRKKQMKKKSRKKQMKRKSRKKQMKRKSKKSR
jgi:hypothetical protein